MLFTTLRCSIRHNIFLKIVRRSPKNRNFTQTTEINIVKSKFPDIEIPNIFLEECIWRGLDKWSNKTATICAETGRSYLYSDIYNKSRATASFLRKLPKVQKNDTVAIVLPNLPEYPIIYLGIIQANLKVTTVNHIYTADEIEKQLKHSETKVIFTLNELWPKVKAAADNLRENIPIVVINQNQHESIPSGAIKFEEIATKNNSLLQINEERSIKDTIVIPYSSGTTGAPKGVELSHKCLVANLHQMSADKIAIFKEAGGEYQEITPIVLPMFHIYGMTVSMLYSLTCGNKLVTVPKFNSKNFLKLLEEYRPTFCHLVPPLILLLLNHPDVKPHHVNQLKKIVSGAAPLGPSDVERLVQKTNRNLVLLQAYGLTEASPLCLIQSTELHHGIEIGGSGFLIPNTECKVVDVEDKEEKGLGPNQHGELYIRGPQVMKGYLKNREATDSTLDPNGWLKTGDIGYYDENEHFFITDRLKELIKVKGFQVAPAELEEILRSHPDVEDAAVVGVPDAISGEAPKAFIIPKSKNKFDPKNVHDFVKSKAASFKQLTGGIVVVDNIPKSASGKILRRELKNY